MIHIGLTTHLIFFFNRSEGHHQVPPQKEGVERLLTTCRTRICLVP